MRFKRLFKRTEPADPFAVFAQTYGIRIPQDDQPPKAEPKAEPKVKFKAESKAEPKVEPKAEPKVEPETELEAEPEVEPEVEPKAGPEAEPEVEPKAEPKAEPKVEPGAELKAEPDDEPQPVELGPTRAHQVLGVRLGASWQEVGRAYKNLAFMHHPDRVAGMDPESREYSEERMKEINAAYDELRRRGT